MMLAVKFIFADALFRRMTDPGHVHPNRRQCPGPDRRGVDRSPDLVDRVGTTQAKATSPVLLRIKAGFLAWILTLIALSLEIDRYFEGTSASALLADPRLAKQVAFSITWSIFAVMSVAAGFKIRLASLRCSGWRCWRSRF